jgi:amphi-Trp domain-containing protein
MTRRRPRDLQRTYSRRQFASKLRRLAAAIQRGRAFTIQVAGERILIPKAARFNIEHERTSDGAEELEFQLVWDRGAV